MEMENNINWEGIMDLTYASLGLEPPSKFDLILAQANEYAPLIIAILLLILGTMIILNQRRIRKELRQLQKLIEASPERSNAELNEK